MGIVVDSYQFTHSDHGSMAKPIIYCNPSKEIYGQAISINIPLAIELKKQGTAMMRTMRMEQDILKVLNAIPENSIIKDFDVMFHPDYQIDVIKTLGNIYRKRPFSVIWSGRYEEGKLYYAEEGYKDYKTFEISDYDITVVI